MKREHKIFITFVFLLSLYISAHEHFNADLKQDANSNTGNVLNAGLQMQGDGAAGLNARQNSIKGEDEAALFKETNGDLGEGIENKTTPLSAEKSGAIKNNTIYKAQDAARALAENIEKAVYEKTGIRKKIQNIMNEKAFELGMKQTMFFNPTGLDISRASPGSFGSAKDVFVLLKYILEKNAGILSETKNKSFFAAPLNQDSREFLNTNLLLDSVPEIMFGKTGYTDLSGGNLALVLRIKKTDYAVIILNSGFYSRFYDTEKIISEIKRN